jgi:hypothetical protein
MRFPHPPSRQPAPVRARAAVFAVGRRVYVACPDAGQAPVPLMGDAGTSGLTSLADGSEVEILAWRPRGSVGTATASG